MASTSWVLLLSAMTVGSLRMMPSPARRSACWRCRGRWRGRAPSARLRHGIKRASAGCTREGYGADTGRARTAATAGGHRRSPGRRARGADAGDGHRTRPPVAPPGQCSCFQIGTVSFSVSMQKRAASNASARCGVDTTTTTAASDTRELAHAVQQRDALEDRPTSARLGGHGVEALDGLLLVGLVGEPGHAVAARRRGRAPRRGTRRRRRRSGWSPRRPPPRPEGTDRTDRSRCRRQGARAGRTPRRVYGGRGPAAKFRRYTAPPDAGWHGPDPRPARAWTPAASAADRRVRRADPPRGPRAPVEEQP